MTLSRCPVHTRVDVLPGVLASPGRGGPPVHLLGVVRVSAPPTSAHDETLGYCLGEGGGPTEDDYCLLPKCTS